MALSAAQRIDTGPAWELDVVAELLQIPVFAELPEDARPVLAAAALPRSFAVRSAIVAQGSALPSLDVLVRGAAKVVRTTKHEAGESSVILDVMRAPQIALEPGFFDGGAASASIVALRASQVISLSRVVVLEFAEAVPSFARALTVALARAMRRQVRRIDEIAAGPVDGRVRALLDGLAADHGAPLDRGRFIPIPLRRADIASMVNATTETVSRILARLEREGALRSTRDGIWWKPASSRTG
jgi:CRP/FNR family transcriptional regulator, cyclic AMP receptor protein